MSIARIPSAAYPCIALKPQAFSSTGKPPQVYAKPGWPRKDTVGLNLRRSEYSSAKLTFSTLTVSAIASTSDLVKESIATKSDLLDLLKMVLHQAEKTSDNGTEITLSEIVVSNKRGALRTENSRSCHKYEGKILFVTNQGADLYYIIGFLDIHRLTHPTLSPDQEIYPQICGKEHKSSLGLVDADLQVEERPYIWTDPQARSQLEHTKLIPKVD